MTLHHGPGYLTLASAVVALVLGLGFVVRGFLQRRAATAFVDRAVATTAVVTAVHPKDVAVAGEPLTITSPRSASPWTARRSRPTPSPASSRRPRGSTTR
ncbi:hypothetical protein NLS1_42530 [Nocardioides sp. LS1]|nr:hypothetical protein NLS1_42530 [Nocardioides sp. LS1]